MKYKIAKWDKVNFHNKKDMAKVGAAVQRCMSVPDLFSNVGELADMKGKRQFAVQNLSNTTNFPEYVTNLMKEYSEHPVYDAGYEAIFDMRQLVGTDGYDVLGTANNIQFEKITDGGKIKFGSSAGEKYRVYVDFYGAGVGVSKRLILARDFYQIEKSILSLRNKAYSKRAEVAYALIEALATTNDVAWQAPLPSTLPNTAETYVANKDAQTISLAVRNLIGFNKDKDCMPMGINTPMIVLFNYQIKSRITKALSLLAQTVAGADKMVNYNLVPVETSMLVTSADYYIIVPKGLLTGATLLELSQYTDFDMTRLNHSVANWMAFGYDIGDIEQIVRCKTA